MARYRSRSRSYNIWQERARQHIREAAELSRELGGTDKDVKAYFFGLSPGELRTILDQYEGAHGRDTREYAEQTMPAWRSGTRQMSGLVASRLFKLLPRYMPLERKYAMVETLWAKHAPRSECSVSFGRNARPEDIRTVVEKHMLETVNGHTIPEPLQRRFQWLAGGDSQAMQQLLNHFLLKDRQEAVAAVYAQIVILLRAAGTDHAIQGFWRELRVGGHTVHVFLDPRATAVTLSRGSPRFKPAPDYSGLGCLGVIIVVIVLIWLLKANSSSNNHPPASSPPHYRSRR